MARGVRQGDLIDGRMGGSIVVYKTPWPKAEENPPVLTLDELRALHERLIVPLQQTASSPE